MQNPLDTLNLLGVWGVLHACRCSYSQETRCRNRSRN